MLTSINIVDYCQIMTKKLHPAVIRLLADIAAYRARTGIKPSAFGRRVTGDGHLIMRIEQGRMPRLGTIDKIYAYMERHGRAVRTNNNHTIVTRVK